MHVRTHTLHACKHVQAHLHTCVHMFMHLHCTHMIVAVVAAATTSGAAVIFVFVIFVSFPSKGSSYGVIGLVSSGRS